MNLTLWIIAGLLAVVFSVAGILKLTLPKEKLAAAPGGEWVDDHSVGFVKTLGGLDLLAAAGLILPAAFDIAPVLVPLAAVGVVLLMVGAMITHLRRRETVPTLLNLTYLVIAIFVAWGRFGPESF
jgi:hypothetical protein